ncbi:LysR substrate-binding domain-containing protein [Achromobacter insuavis]
MHRRRLGRYRHRRRHGRHRRPADLCLPRRPLRADRAGRHALAERAEVAFRDVLDEDFVGLRPQQRAATLPGAAGAGGRQTHQAAVQLRSFDAMCRLVEAGVGVGIVPETTADSMRQLLRVTPVALSDAWAARQLLLCVQSRETLSARARRLLDHLLADAAAVTPPNTDPS